MSDGNKIYLDEDKLIVVEVVGDQTPDSVELMGKEVQVFIDKLKKSGWPVLILDDLTKMGYTSSYTRSIVSDLAKSLSFKKVAMHGSGVMMKYGASFIIRALGQGDKIKYFDDLNAAKSWLLKK
jgi:hypothetical protein